VGEVRRLIAGMTGCDGWVQYASACVVHRSGVGVDRAAAGVPLAAEFVRGSTSVALRQDGDGWLWTEMTEDHGDIRCRVRDTSFVSTAEHTTSLRYREFWRRSAQQTPAAPWEPWIARFVGWSTTGKEKSS